MQSGLIVTTAGSALTGAGAAIGGLGYDQNRDLVTFGATGMLLGVLIVLTQVVLNSINKAHRPAADAYSTGYQIGYANGVREGRQIGRPTVVPFPDRRRGDIPIGSQV